MPIRPFGALLSRISPGLLALLLVLPVVPGSLVAQEHDGKILVQPSLIADADAVVPGRSIEIGLYLETAPGWHTYWEFPGDAGLATAIEWQLPEGVEAGPIQWPMPVKVTLPGEIVDYAYKGSVLLITRLTIPEDFTGERLEIGAAASWLVCEEICVPGDAELSLTLPVAAEAKPANAERFQEFRSRLPSTEAPPFPVTWSKSADGFSIEVQETSGRSIEFFPLPSEEATVGHPRVEASESGARIAIPVDPAAPPFGGLLTAGEGAERRGWLIQAPEETAAAGRASSMPGSAGIGSGAAAPLTLWTALLLGFVGGLILNVMPCVLPVISLKIFGFMNQAGEAPAKIWHHGLAYSGGVFLWFLGLAAIISGLRLAGEQVTWAFQFQNPVFIVGLSAIVFVFALNLAGVFEIVLPGRAGQAMDRAGGTSGYGGSFFQGVFATLLATPCTAPFLGSALGFAFTRSIFEIFALFAAIAFGMALPFLILSAKPGWMRFLPKPGAWMERVKQFMAFPLFATTLWLLYVLGNQRGLEAVIGVGAFLLVLGLCAWIYGAFCGPFAKVAGRAVGFAAILLFGIGGGILFLGGETLQGDPVAKGAPSGKDGIAWVPFSQAELDRLIAEEKTVFLDFTADWCITCKVNERIAIDRPAVRERIRETGTVPMKADWTNSDPEITAALKKFGRVGVPFYVIYPGGDARNPIVLPELLTEQLVLTALDEAFSRPSAGPAPALADAASEPERQEP